MIPIAPIAALTPMLAYAPGDKPPEACDVLGEELFEVRFGRVPDVGVAKFQPMSAMALISVDEVAKVVV